MGRGSVISAPSSPLPWGRFPIRAGVVVDPDVDELLEPAVVADHAQRAVLRVRQVAGGFDHVAQDGFEGQLAGHRLDGSQQRPQSPLGPLHALGPLHELVDQLVELQLRDVGKAEPAPRLAHPRILVRRLMGASLSR